MAKQIKAIKCPHCGSVQNTLVKDDHYRCGNCNTEYFLDNDDVNINVNHSGSINNSDENSKNTPASNTAMFIYIGIFIFGLTVTIFTLNKGNNAAKPTYSSQTSTSATTTAPPSIPLEDRYNDNIELSQAFIAENDKDVTIFSLIYRSYSSSSSSSSGDLHSHYIIRFQNLFTGEIIKTMPLNSMKNDNYSNSGKSKAESMIFDDGRFYIILNQAYVYQVDPILQTLEDITTKLFSEKISLKAGIANVTFLGSSYGSGFALLTIDGKKIFYYPMVDKIYISENELHAAYSHLSSLLNTEKESYRYSFVGPGSNQIGRGNPVELIQLTYKNNYGGPRRFNPRPSWYEGYDKASLQYVDPTTAIRVVADNDLYRIIAHKTLAAGRLYFSPEVIFSDQEHLIIMTKHSASPSAVFDLQKIDIKNGDVLWTIPYNELKAKLFYRYQNGFLAKIDNNHFAIIDADGKISKRITLENPK